VNRPLLRIVAAVALVAAVVGTFRSVVGFELLPLVDDDTNIAFNPNLGALDAGRIAWMFGDLHSVHRYLPLGWMGFSVIYAGWGLDAGAYHGAALGFHAADAVLLFLVLEGLVARFARNEIPPALGAAASLVGALLWAVHPLRVETAAWCSGLLYSQAMAFALLAVLAHRREFDARRADRPGSARCWAAATVGAFAASVLSYPVALLLPLALALIDICGIRSGDAGAAAGASWVAVRRGLAVSLAVCGAVALAALGANLAARFAVAEPWGHPATLRQFGILERVLQASYGIALFVWRTAWPGAAAWMPTTIFDLDPAAPVWWAALATVVVLSGLAWRLRHRAPYFGVCWVLYLIFLLPDIGLAEHPYTAADRYGYLSGMALAAMAAFGLASIRSAALRRTGTAAGLLLGAACMVRSGRWTEAWRNSETYLQSVRRGWADPDFRAIVDMRLAELRFLGGDVRGGRQAALGVRAAAPHTAGVALTWDSMAPHAPMSPEVAARILQEWPAPPWSCLHLEIARGEVAAGRLADSLPHFDAAVGLDPAFAEARLRRGLVLASLGRSEDALHDWFALRPKDSGRRLLAGAVADSLRAAGLTRQAHWVAVRAESQ